MSSTRCSLVAQDTTSAVLVSALQVILVLSWMLLYRPTLPRDARPAELSASGRSEPMPQRKKVV